MLQLLMSESLSYNNQSSRFLIEQDFTVADSRYRATEVSKLKSDNTQGIMMIHSSSKLFQTYRPRSTATRIPRATRSSNASFGYRLGETQNLTTHCMHSLTQNISFRQLWVSKHVIYKLFGATLSMRTCVY